MQKFWSSLEGLLGRGARDLALAHQAHELILQVFGEISQELIEIMGGLKPSVLPPLFWELNVQEKSLLIFQVTS